MQFDQIFTIMQERLGSQALPEFNQNPGISELLKSRAPTSSCCMKPYPWFPVKRSIYLPENVNKDALEENQRSGIAS